MLRLSRQARSIKRRRAKRFLTAALCTASFVTGQWLFGQERSPGSAAQPPSLLGQYRQAKSRMVAAPNQPAQTPKQLPTANPVATKTGIIINERVPTAAESTGDASSATSSRRAFQTATTNRAAEIKELPADNNQSSVTEQNPTASNQPHSDTEEQQDKPIAAADAIAPEKRPVIKTLAPRSEEHTSELQSLRHLVCR